MDPLYLRKLLINRQINNTGLNNIHKSEKAENVNVTQNAQTNIKNQTQNLVQDMRSEFLNPKQLKMNYLASMERSGYVKKVMNLPETLPELLMQLQNEDSIADEIYEPKYHNEESFQGEGQKNQPQKSDITAGIIRNAKESFEDVKQEVSVNQSKQNQNIETQPKNNQGINTNQTQEINQNNSQQNQQV